MTHDMTYDMMIRDMKNNIHLSVTCPWLRSLLLLLLMTLGITEAWGQTHPYAGVWYMNCKKNTAYYMVPAKDPQITTANHVYEDAYFSSNYSSQAGDPEKPFITTYQTSPDLNSIWIFVPVSGEDNYYYIVHALTGKYVKYQQYLSGDNARRKFVHLETITTPGETEKFEITARNTGVKIKPKNNAMYFNVAGDNQPRYNGGTSSPYYSGMVGGMSGTDDNSQFNLIDASSAITLTPEISDVDGATNTFTITSPAAAFSTIRYTTDGSTTPDASTGTETTSGSPIVITDSWTIQAVGVFGSFVTPIAGPKNLAPILCAAPVISYDYSTKMVSITCTTEGAVIHYTTDGSPATSSSTRYTGPFAIGSATTIRAIAVKAGDISNETIFFPPTEVSSSSEITDMTGNYILASDFSSTGSVGTSDNPFKGTIDGNFNPVTLSYPLVAYADGAIIKNVILENDNVTIGDNDNGNAGAICCEATGDTRIYNCGVLGGSVEGDNNVGGIVGLLDGRSRVINCYNYADITSGSNCGGIVGYNNVASTSSNLETMVMNCMFYGNITGGNAAPIYGGANIHNKYASANDTGLNNYCYFLYDEEKNPYVTSIATGNYHGALGAEERFLNRFEFFRMTLNSTRNLAAYYVTGDATQKGEIAKWVLDKSIAPYPILKVQDKYPSIVNPDSEHATTQTERNKGGLLGTLSVTINGTGGGAVFSAPTGAHIVDENGNEVSSRTLTLNITDKDFENYNFNYKKIQLPYYNEVGTGNYTGGRVVTGWKITSITGGTPGTFTNSGTDAPAFNFVDRKCTNKDLYGTDGSNRVFAQGAYWEVPDNVTAITIEPYWAKAVYLSDTNYDMTYTITISGTGSGATATANKYGVTVCGSCPTEYNGQTVYTNLSTAITGLDCNANHTVYDYAVVLVGNYHQAHNNALVNNGRPVTFMSADLDGDNEPDNTLFYYHNQRKVVSPIRFDFLNIPGIGMVKRTHDATMDPEPGILAPQGWFEITNTVFIRFGQFEYAGSNAATKTILAPLILQGGIYEQFVSCCRTNAQNTNYLLIGGNAWFKNFANGCHTNQANKTPKVPINVAGGDYTNFYLTGIYQPASNEDAGNAECYIDGGRFQEIAGAGMQQVKGDVTWLINAADISSFYGGGINAAKPITGSISNTISNSYVDEFYGGPKFGDMDEEKTVITNATDCHFGKFFGAGYGGTAFNKVLPASKYDSSSEENTRTWDSWVTAEYKRAYSAGNGGISTNYEYEFILHSDGNQTVARFYVDYASLSLATTRNVTSTLSGCTIGTFYGGGSLGAVNGNVTSTLTDCTVTGNAFGAGFSASVPTVEVWNAGANLVPNPTYNRTANVFNNASVKTPKDNGQYVVYTWSNDGSTTSPFTDTEDGKHYIYTDVSLENLGTVSGDATLTINGTTTVGGSVYGGGEESNVLGNTNVTMTDGYVFNGIFGGGLSGSVGTFTRSTDPSDVNIFGHTAHDGCIGKPTACAEGTGKCTIVVSGGQIGPIEVATQGMNRAHAQGGPVPEGWVWGGGRGLVQSPAENPDVHFTAYVNETDVTIKDNAFILESIIGGGEFGRVLGNTKVKIEGGQIGVGAGMVDANNKPKRYTDAQFVNPLTTTITSEKALAPCSHYPYGKTVGGITVYDTYDPYADEYKQAHGGSLPTGLDGGSTDNASDGKTWIGCVFGGGSGYFPYKITGTDGKITDYGWVESAGLVEGNTEVIISGGHILSNVYGANEYTTVQGESKVTMTGGTIGVPRTKAQIEASPKLGHLFGGGKGDPRPYFYNKTNTGSVEIDISGGIIYGSVYGGGESGTVKDGVAVSMSGGVVLSDVYGGGALADTQTSNWDASANSGAGGWASGKTSTSATTTVRLTGGIIGEDVFGGGLGEAGTDQNSTGMPAYVYGDVLVELNKDVADDAKGCVVGQIFGCNNINGTPKGDVKVHIYKTQNKAATRITNAPASGTEGQEGYTEAVEDAKVDNRYDVHAVYGGGNQSAYEPADQTNNKSEVIIDGCDKTSIEQVYGGGKAASSPATNVTVNGTYEINQVFGGGNGKDQITVNGVLTDNPGANVGFKSDGTTSYGTGIAQSRILGGKVHYAYGGSNTKGDVRVSANVYLSEDNDDCPLQLDEIYGGGNEAPMSGNSGITLGCISYLKTLYGGSRAAELGGDVNLTITSGHFERVFGGNNVSGEVKGTITINIEETGCHPITIGELYGGGNQAPYSVENIATGRPDLNYSDPTAANYYRNFPKLNIKSFTSIGRIFGGGLGSSAEVTGNPTVNVNVVMGGKNNGDVTAGTYTYNVPTYFDANGNFKETTLTLDGTTIKIPAHTKGKIGAIGTIFGGGNAAPVVGNTNVNIGTKLHEYIEIPAAKITVGTTDVSLYYTRSGSEGAYSYSAASGTAVANTTYYEKVLGADIRGNVYGGGNAADVTKNTTTGIGGNTNVVIGK